MIADKVKESVSTKDAAEQEIRQAFKRLVDVTMKHRDAWNRFVDSPGLSVQGEVSGLGFVASGGMFVPVTSATTISLAAPVASTAGLPLAVWNGSGGIVLLEPVGSTLNGASLGWVGPGLHVLYPDATNWFGGSSRSVELFSSATISGNATGGGGQVTLPTRPGAGTYPLLVAAYGQQGTGAAGTVYQGASAPGPQQNLVALAGNAATTVRADAYWMTGDRVNSENVDFPANGTSLVRGLFFLIGAAQDGVGASVSTDSAGTTLSASVTTVRPGAMVVQFIVNDTQADVATFDAGQTELYNSNSSSPGTSTVALHASYRVVERPGTVSVGVSGLTDITNKAAVTFVIEPAEGV